MPQLKRRAVHFERQGCRGVCWGEEEKEEKRRWRMKVKTATEDVLLWTKLRECLGEARVISEALYRKREPAFPDAISPTIK